MATAKSKAASQEQTVGGTLLTMRQEYVSPNGEVAIPHVEAGWCQVVNAEYVGGGGEKRFLLTILSLEPLSGEDLEAWQEAHPKPTRRDQSDEF